jgi:hypothetical protein
MGSWSNELPPRNIIEDLRAGLARILEREDLPPKLRSQEPIVVSPRDYEILKAWYEQFEREAKR